MLVCELSDDIKQMKMCSLIQGINGQQNRIFCEHFLNKDTSFPIPHKSTKFYTCNNEMLMKGKLSQNFDIGPRFIFM